MKIQNKKFTQRVNNLENKLAEQQESAFGAVGEKIDALLLEFEEKNNAVSTHLDEMEAQRSEAHTHFLANLTDV